MHSREKQRKISKMFCSSLIAATYQHMGLVDWSTPPEKFSPKTFAKLVFLEQGAQLDDLVLFRKETPSS